MNLDAFQTLWLKVRPYALPAWLCFFALLCLTGLNPYFRPDYHDNITYYVAAESLLAGDGYTFQGAPIADWPPVTSLILAAVFAIFGTSIYAAKLVSIAAAIISVLLANRLLRRERRPDRLKTIALFTLTPIALLTATTVASDWICAAFSFACLLTLWHLREKRGLPLAIAVGLLLGLAALTRQTGVLLGAAIAVQAVSFFYKRGIRAVLPEALAACIGASMYLGWTAYTVTQLAKHPPLTGNYANQGLALFTDFSFSELAISIFDLFWKWDDVLDKIGVPTSIATALLIIPSAILITGVISIIRRRQIQPSDFYALAFLALLFGYHWKMGRYLLPIAPFLFAWFFVGLRSISTWYTNRRPTSQPGRDLLVPIIGALWVALLVPLNAYVLFNQSGNGANRGISPLINNSPADYYEGKWADLHAACEAIKDDGQPGAVAASGFFLRYVKAFTGRQATDSERMPDAPTAYAIFIADESYSDPKTFSRPGDTTIFQTDKVTVYRRAR
ncbi:MAG: 4-amino-4-deoxy-L-arabinose transferase-like glycosyltransferase [Pseudoalteromonas tetraodonis]